MFEAILPPVFVLAALLYLALAAWVSRRSPGSAIAAFMFLLGVMVAGSAFSYDTSDPNLYGVGRVLTFTGAGFLPVVLYTVYRQFTDGEFSWLLVGAFCIIPSITVILSLTNPFHNLVWETMRTTDGVIFSSVTDHLWYRSVHAPFAYGLLAYSVIGLTARLSTVALAHRKPIAILLVCVLLPTAVSIGNTILRIGPIDFPFTVSTVVLLLPVYVYAALAFKDFEFSPLAYRTLFNHVRDPIIVLDEQQKIICMNLKACEMLGRTEKEMLGRLLWEDYPEARRMLEQAGEMDLTQTLRFRNDLVYEVSVAPLLDNNGESQGTVVVCRDVTQRRRTLSQLADNEHLIRTLIETSSNGILRFALDEGIEEPVYRCIFANKAAEAYLVKETDVLIGKRLSELSMLQPDRLTMHFTDRRRVVGQKSFEQSMEDEAGKVSWLRITAEPIGQDFSVTILDITQRKENEDRMLEQALRDPLTSVLNRRGFEARANEQLRNCSVAGIIYLDLNGFKNVNDGYGHQAGDALLKAFGHRLGYCLRPEDVLGRLGGDEFAIVLPEIEPADVLHIAERLVQTGSEAYIIKAQEVRCSVSVGVAMMPEDGEELWHLISVADQNMYSAKAEAANEDEAEEPPAGESQAS